MFSLPPTAQPTVPAGQDQDEREDGDEKDGTVEAGTSQPFRSGVQGYGQDVLFSALCTGGTNTEVIIEPVCLFFFMLSCCLCFLLSLFVSCLLVI